MAARPGGSVPAAGNCDRPEIADADHADLVIGHPRLVGHDLDGVVGVVVRRVAEEVEGTARAARPPHLEADRGEAGHPGQNRSHRGGGVRKQVRIAAVGARRMRGPERESPESGRWVRRRCNRSTR